MPKSQSNLSPALDHEPRTPLHAPELLASYCAWLFMERRLLCHEMKDRWGPGAEGMVPHGTAADAFHFPRHGSWQDVPTPSTRAAKVLSAVGCPPCGTPKPDPIFKAIEAHRAAHLASENSSDSEYDGSYQKYARKWQALKRCKPTSLEGILALTLHVVEHEKRLGTWNPCDGASQGLDMVAKAAARFLPQAAESMNRAVPKFRQGSAACAS